MVSLARRAATRLAVCGAVLTTACGDNPVAPPPEVASITVTSPIDTVLVIGGSATLTAAAKTSSGDPIQAQFDWSSSNDAVAKVSSSGHVEALSVGSAVITAESGSKSGQLRVRVVDADLGVIAALINDPLRAHLMSGLRDEARAIIQGALGNAQQASSAGNVIAIRNAYLAVGAAADAATEPTDRALLAMLRLFVDHALRLLKL